MTNVGTSDRQKTRRLPWMLGGGAIGILLLTAVIMLILRQRETERRQDLQLLQGVRKVCKLATVEVSLADYSRRTLPKKLDLPFTGASHSFLFYSGVVSAGFDVCDEPFRINIDHTARTVEVVLPPPRILSLDIKRFEIINERSALLNAIEPEDRNRWYQDAREALQTGALQSDVLAKARNHARELFEGFVERWGYRLQPWPTTIVPVPPR